MRFLLILIPDNVLVLQFWTDHKFITQMKRLVFLCIVLSAFGCNQEVQLSQETEEALSTLPANAEKTPYPGNSELVKVTVRFPDGKLQNQGDFLNGKKDGTWTEYHSNGLIKSMTSYVQGKKQGNYIEIDERGELQLRAYYHNDLKDGDYVVYNQQRIKEQRSYNQGQLQGVVKIYYDNGSIMEESPYTNGKRDGLSKWYDQQGNITIEYEYDQGELVE